MQHVLNALDKIAALLGQIAALHPMGGMHGGRLNAITADIAAARDEHAARTPHETPAAVEDAELSPAHSVASPHGHKMRGRPRKHHA